MKLVLKQPKRVKDLLNTVKKWFSTRIANILKVHSDRIQFENITFLTLNSCGSMVTSIFLISRVTMSIPLTLPNRHEFEVGFTKFAESVFSSNFLGTKAVIHTNLDTNSELLNQPNEEEMCKHVKETKIRVVFLSDSYL